MGCKAGDKCLFPHYKVDEQPKKKPKKSYYFTKKEEKAMTRMLWLLWKVYHNWVAYQRLGSIGFSKWKTVSVKPDAKSFGTNSKDTIH